MGGMNVRGGGINHLIHHRGGGRAAPGCTEPGAGLWMTDDGRATPRGLSSERRPQHTGPWTWKPRKALSLTTTPHYHHHPLSHSRTHHHPHTGEHTAPHLVTMKLRTLGNSLIHKQIQRLRISDLQWDFTWRNRKRLRLCCRTVCVTDRTPREDARSIEAPSM